jgi:hypothetical protein
MDGNDKSRNQSTHTITKVQHDIRDRINYYLFVSFKEKKKNFRMIQFGLKQEDIDKINGLCKL